MARAGSIWVESTELHWLDSTATEQSVFGDFVTGDSHRAGSIWVEGTALHFMNENGNSERNIVGSLIAAGSRRAGSLWVEGDDLHYIDALGDERALAAAVCSTYTFTTAVASSTSGDCVFEGGSCDPQANIRASWTAKSTCTPGHMEFWLSINGGSFVSRRHTGDCNQANFDYGAGGTLWTNQTLCDTWQCTKACAARTFAWKLEMHKSATDHTICDTITSATTSTKYYCTCRFCLQGV